MGTCGLLLFTGCGGGCRQSPSLVDGVECVMVGELKPEEMLMWLVEHQQRSENAEC